MNLQGINAETLTFYDTSMILFMVEANEAFAAGFEDILMHEMAMENRIAARPAPSCEPKNIEFLLDSDMYLWILSI